MFPSNHLQRSERILVWAIIFSVYIFTIQLKLDGYEKELESGKKLQPEQMVTSQFFRQNIMKTFYSLGCIEKRRGSFQSAGFLARFAKASERVGTGS